MSSPLRDELKGLIKLAAPLALAQAGQALMGVVDTAVVGRVSDVAQGAVGLGNGLVMSVAVLGLGVMLAFDPLVSQAIGAGKPERARTLFWQAVGDLKAGGGIALPDCFCVVLSQRLGAEAVTADRTEFTAVLIAGFCPVYFIR